jgi:hypothetical protein
MTNSWIEFTRERCWDYAMQSQANELISAMPINALRTRFRVVLTMTWKFTRAPLRAWAQGQILLTP